MKTIAFFFLAALPFSLHAQLKTTTSCPNMVVNILDGNVDGLPPNATAGQVKTMFPCFNRTANTCGETIFYDDRKISFYTGRGYVEIREGFKGRLTLPLLGASRSGLFKWLGLPKIKDKTWDAFQTQYGTLIVYYNGASKVNKIQMTNYSSEQIKLCD
jgi:hypothetical protein